MLDVTRRFAATGGRSLRQGQNARAGQLVVLDRINLQITAGKFVAVLGPSGSGKSTMLALMAGLDRPSEGQVRVEGREIQRLGEDELARLRRRRIGFVFQSFQLLGNLTALENVMLPLEMLGRKKARSGATEILERVGLAERINHYPSQLSGGEQQRVAMARAFGPEPPILLADEPTGNLDASTGRTILDLLLELRDAHKTTMVLVTHDPKVADLAQMRIHLEAGRVVRTENAEGSSRPQDGKSAEHEASNRARVEPADEPDAVEVSR
ncbi:MAG: ABC transporter ATP-binding protein [Phycisphaeraceae bacterium]|nr:ABC transporter ATP-binding protein [Phycisphaeraceae bacterium]